MKHIKYTFLATILSLGFLALETSGQTAPQPRGEVTYYGMHTMAAGTSLRLGIVNRFPVSDGEIIPCIRVRIVVDFYRAAGDGSVRPVFVRRAEREILLDPGDAASYDLPSSRLGGEIVNVTVFFTPVGQDLPESPHIAAATILEVRESGRTIFTLPGIPRGFDPQPDPPR